MKRWKRVLALALALGMTAALAGCGDKKAEEASPSPSEAVTPSASPEPSGTMEFLPDNEVDTAQEVLGISKDLALLTVNGQAVPAQRYLYWLGNMTAYYNNMYMQSYYMGLDLTAEVEEGVTWDDRLKEIAYENTVMLALAPELAQHFGISMSQEEVESLYETSRGEVAQRGEESYRYELQCMGIDDREEFDIRRLATLFEKVQNDYVEKALAGQGEGAISDADVAGYIEEKGLLRCKHILLLTTDMTTGQPYDDEKKAEQKAKAEDILAQLRGDPAQFDTLMKDNSEDTGLANYPDGYLFGPGEMVSAFENTTKALEVGAISDIVESEYGYHIIQRLDSDCDESRERLAAQRFNDMINEWIEGAAVEKAPEYDTITAKGYYEGISALQATFTDPDAQENTPTLETYSPPPATTGEP